MITKEQLLNSSHSGKIASAEGRPKKGVLTLLEAEVFRERFNCVYTQCRRFDDKPEMIFFTDDYCIGVDGTLSKNWVVSSSQIPHSVVPREGFEDGQIKSVSEFISLYHPNAKIIESIEELVEILNQ